jgi:hypothetical protein
VNDHLHFGRGAIIGLLLLLLGTSAATAHTLAAAKSRQGAPAPALPADTTRFAVIGDYGSGSNNARDVANLIAGWNVDFVVTVGDNNYPDGAAATIDDHIGQYFSSFIYPYTGQYRTSSPPNRFFPSLGNHDWMTTGAAPYLNYFTLPGNERYYDTSWGPVHLFAVDSDSHEPDGRSSTSAQATWLHTRLAAATEPWKLVYMHHAPYSSGGEHGSNPTLQWPYQQWGASAVLAGHDHDYERIVRDGFPYLVNGLGGASTYGFGTPVSGSVVRYNADYGALLVTANTTTLTFQFISRANYIVDTYTLTTGATTATPAPPPGSTATRTPTATRTGTPARTPTLTRTPTRNPANTPSASATATPRPNLTATPTAGPSIFSDGFESANLSTWTSSGGLAVQNAQAHSGSYAAEANTTNGNTYAKKTLPSTYANGWARIYFNLLSYSSPVNLLRLRTAGDTSLVYLFVSTTGQLGLRNDVNSSTRTSSTLVGSGWHALTLHVVVNGTASTTEVWLDGVPVSDLAMTTNLGSTPIGRLQIGEVNTGRTYRVLFDDVVFDTQ